MDSFFISVLAVLAGMGASVQAGVNYQLQAHWAKSSILAAFVSFFVGTLSLLLVVIVAGIPIPAFPETIIPWHWAGGFLGAYLVTIMVVAAPRLGAATMIALVLAGQIGISLILDHFGLFGYAQKAVSWQRLLGASLVGTGVFLIRKS